MIVLIRYGTQEFFDELKIILNSDQNFRSLGKGTYNTTELIIVEDMGIGIYQRTADGEIIEMKLVPKYDLPLYESSSEFVYYVNGYEDMVQISTGDESFISLIIGDKIRFKGSLKKAMTFQGANERMEEVLKTLTSKTIIPSAIQYRKWASQEEYL